MVKPITYYSTNDKDERADFKTALLKGMGSNYGLFMVAREEIPGIGRDRLLAMNAMSYAEIAFEVLSLFLGHEVPEGALRELLADAYREDRIPTVLERVTGRTHIMWLTRGPTYSFKDYAARFFGRMLNYFLGQIGARKVVVVATSGDTG